MPLVSGTRLGPYEVLLRIGAGGMGEVYKARDTRLDRTVAIKLLPADLAERPDRRRRFEAEARAISALSHPHICTLFDVGEQDGRAFLVMEHLEGETLDDRLTRGPLPAPDVVRYAIQIAGALDHAHREHIVHRDLKPSNIFLVRSGGASAPPNAKLLDFGLARRPAFEPAAAGNLTTLSFDQRKLTAEGTILGTFQYMAPEQLEGKEADARTDIFAFGTLVYEMATGRRAFEGSSQASLIASILTGQPPAISTARQGAGLPPALDHVVERCLAKNPDDRWQTARDVKLELEWIAGGSAQTTRAASAPRHRGREVIAWAIALLAIAVAGIAVAFGLRREAPEADLMRFAIVPPSGSVIPFGENSTRLAISPDGRQLAFVGLTDGRLQIWLRPLASMVARPLAGTEGGVSPFWSPNSRYIGFFSPGTGELKKVDVAGGPSRTICSASMEGVPEWGPDGTILFMNFRDGIFRVSADGGAPARVTSIDKARREINHYWPSFLPDGKHFTYMATANDTDTSKAIPSVYVAALDGSEKTLLTRIHSKVVYAPPGYLLFAEEGALLAQAFDVATLRPIGEATQIADGVAFFRGLGTGHFAVSANGTLAYLGSGDANQILWYDRHGNTTDTGWAKQNYGSLRISSDGQQVAVDVTDPRSGTADIWIYDLARNVPRRFTSDPVTERDPAWSPDLGRILFTTERGSAPNLFTKAFEGTGDVEAMVVHSGPLSAEDWSPDGRTIAYTMNTRQTFSDIWMKPLDGDRKERPFLNMRFEEWGARFSPDSSMVAFVSNEAGAIPEVYVAPVGHPAQRRQVSIGGGTGPRWRRDGKELFYISADSQTIMSAPIESVTPFRAGVPTRLFALGTESPSRGRTRNTIYDVMPDGQRFLVSVGVGELESSRITVVLNWPAAFEALR